MKIQGIEKLEANVIEHVILRPNQSLVFKLQPVDMKFFNDTVEEPQPRVINKPGQAPVKELTGENYLKALEDYNEKRNLYFLLSSLQATPDLEFEKVKMEEPDTWEELSNELEELGLLPAEVVELTNAALRANALDADYIAEKRAEFLTGQEEAQADQD